MVNSNIVIMNKIKEIMKIEAITKKAEALYNAINKAIEDEELKTGGPKIILTAIGIGYHNLTKTLI